MVFLLFFICFSFLAVVVGDWDVNTGMSAWLLSGLLGQFHQSWTQRGFWVTFFLSLFGGPPFCPSSRFAFPSIWELRMIPSTSSWFLLHVT